MHQIPADPSFALDWIPAAMWGAYSLFVICLILATRMPTHTGIPPSRDYSRPLWLVIVLPLLLLPPIAWWGLGFYQFTANGPVIAQNTHRS